MTKQMIFSLIGFDSLAVVVSRPDYNGGNYFELVEWDGRELSAFNYIMWNGSGREFCDQQPTFSCVCGGNEFSITAEELAENFLNA